MAQECLPNDCRSLIGAGRDTVKERVSSVSCNCSCFLGAICGDNIGTTVIVISGFLFYRLICEKIENEEEEYIYRKKFWAMYNIRRIYHPATAFTLLPKTQIPEDLYLFFR